MNEFIGLVDTPREHYGDVHIHNRVYGDAYRIASKLLAVDTPVSSHIPSVIAEELECEFESGRLAYIGKFYQQFAEYTGLDEGRSLHLLKTINVVEDVDTHIGVNLHNAILYSEACQVVILRYMLFDMPYHYAYKDLIFARDKQAIDRYAKSVIDNSRIKYNNSILMMTDTSDSIEKQLLPKDASMNLDGVLLDDYVKTEIVRSVDSFFTLSEEFYKQYNIPYRRGILLYGKPGNGKTTLIKAISNSTTQPTVYWQVNEYSSSYSIEQVFKYVKSISPVLLIIEDIDSLPERCRSMFLNYLDGTRDNEGIFLIGTTNYPDRIDPALMNRAGRFDRAYEIKTPSTEMREDYLRRKGLANFVSDDDIKLAAKLMDGFSMSMLNELYTLCALAHHYDGHVNVRDVVDKLKVVKTKQRTDEWFGDDEARSMGFTPSM